MIRAGRLAVSRPMYAFDPSTWRTAGYGGFEVDAAWFRRKNGRVLAAMGTYHPMVMRGEPVDGSYEAWIAAADDNRYGGHHVASWDGHVLLNTDPPAVEPAVAAARMEFLDAMLKAFPNPPSGFDGWWTFNRTTSR